VNIVSYSCILTLHSHFHLESKSSADMSCTGSDGSDGSGGTNSPVMPLTPEHNLSLFTHHRDYQTDSRRNGRIPQHIVHWTLLHKKKLCVDALMRAQPRRGFDSIHESQLCWSDFHVVDNVVSLLQTQGYEGLRNLKQSGCTVALCIASCSGASLEIIRLLTEEGKALVSFSDSSGRSALQCAIHSGQDAVASYLLEHGMKMGEKLKWAVNNWAIADYRLHGERDYNLIRNNIRSAVTTGDVSALDHAWKCQHFGLFGATNHGGASWLFCNCAVLGGIVVNECSVQFLVDVCGVMVQACHDDDAKQNVLEMAMFRGDDAAVEYWLDMACRSRQRIPYISAREFATAVLLGRLCTLRRLLAWTATRAAENKKRKALARSQILDHPVYSALISAVQLKAYSFAELLVAHIASTAQCDFTLHRKQTKDYIMRSPFHTAICLGNVRLAEMMYRDTGLCDLTKMDTDGTTLTSGAIKGALSHKNTGTVKWLYDQTTCASEENMCIILAVSYMCDDNDSHLDVLKDLLEHVSSSAIECRDESGKTPLLLAASCAKVRAFQLIQQYGAKMDAQDSENEGFVILAARSHSVAMLELASRITCVKSVVGRNGDNVLHIAACDPDCWAALLLWVLNLPDDERPDIDSTCSLPATHPGQKPCTAFACALRSRSRSAIAILYKKCDEVGLSESCALEVRDRAYDHAFESSNLVALRWMLDEFPYLLYRNIPKTVRTNIMQSLDVYYEYLYRMYRTPSRPDYPFGLQHLQPVSQLDYRMKQHVANGWRFADKWAEYQQTCEDLSEVLSYGPIRNLIIAYIPPYI
jgi:ankyrin repeat protein